jgi:putative thioredoxin
MSQNNMNLRGAVDLGAVAAAKEAQVRAEQVQATKEVSPIADKVIIDVTTETFEDLIIKQSATVPVVIDLWATWCGPCKQLSPVLEQLALEYNGKFVLAKIDVDAQPQISQAFQVQSIPTVFVAIGGQVAPLFQGAQPLPQVKQVIDAVLEQAKQLGVTGNVNGAEDADDQPVTISDPRFDAAEAALEEGDWDGAIAAYKLVINSTPNDPIAKIGLLNVELLKRMDGIDFEAAISTASTDIPAQLTAADAEFLMNQYSQAFARLIELIRSNTGKDRDLVRDRLVELFEIAGPTDPAVISGRTALANALF